MLEIVTAVAERNLPRATGVAIITSAFPLTAAQAEAVMGEVAPPAFFARRPPPCAPKPFGAPPADTTGSPRPDGDARPHRSRPRPPLPSPAPPRRPTAREQQRTGSTPADRSATRGEIVRSIASVGRGFRVALEVPGRHYSGLTYDELLEILADQGRDFAATTTAMRRAVLAEVTARYEGARRAPTDAEIRGRSPRPRWRGSYAASPAACATSTSAR